MGTASENVEFLKPSVYRLTQSDDSPTLFLKLVSATFDLPAKIYSMDIDFIERAKKTFERTVGNLGILLTGVKGSGKTVTAKQISNRLNLPVVIVNQIYNRMPAFINDIKQDVIVFIDEYEKIYPDDDSTLLPLMDGAMSSKHRRVFLLTTNSIYVNSNMLQRPGRIRYVREYVDLPLEVIMEVVDDKLIHKHLRAATVDFISKLKTITIDIIQAVIEEVNIHEEDPEEFEDVFNVKRITKIFNFFQVVDGKEMLLRKNLSHSGYDQDNLGQNYRPYGQYLGDVTEVLDANTVKLKTQTGETKTFRMCPAEMVHFSFVPGAARTEGNDSDDW